MPKKTTANGSVEPVKVTVSSGNVYADMGLPDPGGRAAKAELAREINARLDERRLTQAAAARLLRLHQPQVSLLRNGQLSEFSMERLLRCLEILDVGVEFRFYRKVRRRPALRREDHRAPARGYAV